MNCIKCGEVIEYKSKFCWNCGEKIVTDKKNDTVKINTGVGSINLGVGSGNNVQIEKFIASTNTENSNSKIYYNRTEYGNPITTKKFKVVKNSIISVGSLGTTLGILSSTLSIINDGFQIEELRFFNAIMPFAICILFFGLYMNVVYKEILTQEFKWIRINSLINFRLYKGNNNQILKLNIDGVCPKCGGKVKLSKNKDSGKIIGFCSKNHEHKFDFDHTNFTGKEIIYNKS